MTEIPHNTIWMILIKTLNNFSIPFYVAFILCQKRFFYVFEEIIWCLVDVFLFAVPMVIFIVVMEFWLFDWFVFLTSFVLLFLTNHFAVYWFHHFLWEFRFNVTTNDWKQFICFSVLWQFIEEFKWEFINKFVENFFVQSYEKWEVNVGQVNVEFWLLILVFFKRDWHCIKIF